MFVKHLLCSGSYTRGSCVYCILKCHKNFLEGIKNYSEVGTPSKGFQLETNCFVSVFVCLFFALSV